MSLKETIEKDLQESQSLDESLRKNNKRVEDLFLEILRENRELNTRIEETEKTIKNWILDMLSPW